MIKFTFRILSLFTLMFSLNIAFAEPFVVKAVRVEGLIGPSQASVVNKVAVIGKSIDLDDASQLIQDLYSSGFFSDVQLNRFGNTLIIRVKERPIIRFVQVSGNRGIPKERLDEALKKLGLESGQFFNQAKLANIQTTLKSELISMGRAHVNVITTVKKEPNNRVKIDITITEQGPIKVKKITILGVKAFHTFKVEDEMWLATGKPWSFITRSNEFSDEKWETSLEAIRNYYLNRGYYDFKIKTAEPRINKVANTVELFIEVEEGAKYIFTGNHLGGSFNLTKEQTKKAITTIPGEIYSLKELQRSSENLKHEMGTQGYGNAKVNPIPIVDKADKKIAFIYYLDQGNLTYIRRINIVGNVKTKDAVFRRVVEQMEGSLINTEKLLNSFRKISMTGFAEDIRTETVAIANKPDLVDINFHLREKLSDRLMGGVGYGTDGWVVQASAEHNNFFGTGNSIGLSVTVNKYSRNFGINYLEPFYTIDGIQRNFNFFYQKQYPIKTDPVINNQNLYNNSFNNLNSSYPNNINPAQYKNNYIIDAYGFGVSYQIPFGPNDENIQLGAGFQNNNLSINPWTSQQIKNFISDNDPTFDVNGSSPKQYKNITANVGWSKNSLDTYMFPTTGTFQDVSLVSYLPPSSSQISYYKLNYGYRFFYPLTQSKNFILTGRTSLGYGNGFGKTKGLPIYANYFAGGAGSGYAGQVRGYESGSLGPRDSQARQLGGNAFATASLALIFPNFISKERLRTSLFVDGGNVYTTLSERLGGYRAPGGFRTAVGLAFDLHVPVLNVIFNVNVAKAINRKPANLPIQVFSFNIGANF